MGMDGWGMHLVTISFDVVVLKNTFFVVTAPGSVPGCVWLCQNFCVSDFSLVVVFFLFVLFDLFLFLIFFCFVCFFFLLFVTE